MSACVTVEELGVERFENIESHCLTGSCQPSSEERTPEKQHIVVEAWILDLEAAERVVACGELEALHQQWL